MAPAWVEHALWWHVYPLGFTGAEPAADAATPVTHRLAHVERWLDYLVDLGLNGLALGPVLASATHGYDTVDHLRVDPRLGDRDDLDRLLAAAHERGVRVLLDGVFNHVGDQHPLFRAALEGGPGAPEAELFRIRWADGVPEWDCFEGHRSLVTLNHDSPRVVDLVADVMTHWLDAGADGWRLDAAYAVPTAFWRQVTDRVRAAHPDAYLMGEVIHGDYTGFVAESGVDSVTQYELWKAIWSSVVDRNWHELAWTLSRHDEFLDAFVPYTFVGNHDVTRLTSRVGDATLAGHALVVLMTVGGTPAVYYGDEQAYRGVKEDRAGGDDAVRPPYPPTPEDLAGPDVAPDGRPTHDRHAALIGLRRRHPWLHTARTHVVEVTGTHLAYESRAADGAATLLVALNLDDDPWPFAPPAGARLVASDGGPATGGVGGRCWAVWEV
ncbi:alpha-amylase family protein [Cellulomonas sp. C5510]|uniref:alpha-amylase family protein n=1 Tax=Cellulomonas sp. C5510 TaxID=2871170 RepID=UPI001C93A039|nr:alpha-amylase family protein [Cellulomonas sp. C5510]QZN85113.1 alpha-amylase family protein [Cellulomonas sp. C5510]